MQARPVTETEYADHLAAMADREARDRAEFEATTDATPGDLLLAALLLLAYVVSNGAWWLLENVIQMSGGLK